MDKFEGEYTLIDKSGPNTKYEINKLCDQYKNIYNTLVTSINEEFKQIDKTLESRSEPKEYANGIKEYYNVSLQGKLQNINIKKKENYNSYTGDSTYNDIKAHFAIELSTNERHKSDIQSNLDILKQQEDHINLARERIKFILVNYTNITDSNNNLSIFDQKFYNVIKDKDNKVTYKPKLLDYEIRGDPDEFLDPALKFLRDVKDELNKNIVNCCANLTIWKGHLDQRNEFDDKLEKLKRNEPISDDERKYMKEEMLKYEDINIEEANKYIDRSESEAQVAAFYDEFENKLQNDPQNRYKIWYEYLCKCTTNIRRLSFGNSYTKRRLDKYIPTNTRQNVKIMDMIDLLGNKDIAERCKKHEKLLTHFDRDSLISSFVFPEYTNAVDQFLIPLFFYNRASIGDMVKYLLDNDYYNNRNRVFAEIYEDYVKGNQIPLNDEEYKKIEDNTADPNYPYQAILLRIRDIIVYDQSLSEGIIFGKFDKELYGRKNLLGQLLYNNYLMYIYPTRTFNDPDIIFRNDLTRACEASEKSILVSFSSCLADTKKEKYDLSLDTNINLVNQNEDGKELYENINTKIVQFMDSRRQKFIDSAQPAPAQPEKPKPGQPTAPASGQTEKPKPGQPTAQAAPQPGQAQPGQPTAPAQPSSGQDAQAAPAQPSAPPSAQPSVPPSQPGQPAPQPSVQGTGPSDTQPVLPPPSDTQNVETPPDTQNVETPPDTQNVETPSAPSPDQPIDTSTGESTEEEATETTGEEPIKRGLYSNNHKVNRMDLWISNRRGYTNYERRSGWNKWI